MEVSDIPLTRDPSEGRGMFGRVDEMTEVSQKLDQAKAEGQLKDQEAIHKNTEKAVKAVTKFIEKVGGGAERFGKFADRLFRGGEASVKKTVEEGWQVVQGLGEDTVDVLKGTAKGVLVGAKWVGIAGAVAAAAIVAAPIVITQTVALGLVELGQHGAKGLAEARKSTKDLLNKGVLAFAASIKARALTSDKYEAKRIDQVRDQHRNRVATIRDNNLGVQVIRVARENLNK